MKNILMVPYAAGEYIEVAKGADIGRFVFDDLRQQIKWVMAVRRIGTNIMKNPFMHKGVNNG